MDGVDLAIILYVANTVNGSKFYGEFFIPGCCHDHDHEDLEHTLPPVILIVGLLLVLTIVIIVTCCWCYHKKMRRREMAILTEKGELIVLKDDGKRTEGHGPLVIRLSQLESRRV